MLLLILINIFFFLFFFKKEYFKYAGVKILCFSYIFFEISLSIAIEEDNTPECVYLTFSVSKIA